MKQLEWVEYLTSASNETVVIHGLDNDGVLLSTKVCHVERLHVEELLTLKLREQFKTLETSGLLKVSGDGTRLTTRSNQAVGIMVSDVSG